MDPKVFTENSMQWEEMLKNLNLTENDIFNRYEAVIQLFTAPKEYYTVEDNPARRETFEEAEKINTKYEIVWKNHQNFHQVDNYDHRNHEKHDNVGWNEKFNHVWNIVKDIIEN